LFISEFDKISLAPDVGCCRFKPHQFQMYANNFAAFGAVVLV